jgi:hypothetical protein
MSSHIRAKPGYDAELCIGILATLLALRQIANVINPVFDPNLNHKNGHPARAGHPAQTRSKRISSEWLLLLRFIASCQ